MNRRIEIVLMPRLDELPDLTAFDALINQAGAAPAPGTPATPAVPTPPSSAPETSPSQ
jgi:hypothetical protein